jgi:hypothetical protein
VVLTLNDRLIARLPIPKVSLVRNPSVREELHGPVDGRMSNALHVPLYSHRQVFHGNMALRVEKCAQDGTPLPGVFKIVALQMLFKELCEMSNIRHHSPPLRT